MCNQVPALRCLADQHISKCFKINDITARFGLKLVVLCLLQLALASGLNKAQAHEVIPSIVDFEVVNDTIEIELKASLEAFMAGVDLSKTVDINLSLEADAYDKLRKLSSAELQARFEGYWPQMQSVFQVVSDEKPLGLELVDIETPEDVPFDLVRVSTLTVIAPLAEDTDAVEIVVNERLGSFVIRENGVEEPFTGYLQGGGRTPSIDVKRPSAWDRLWDVLSFF